MMGVAVPSQTPVRKHYRRVRVRGENANTAPTADTALFPHSTVSAQSYSLQLHQTSSCTDHSVPRTSPDDVTHRRFILRHPHIPSNPAKCSVASLRSMTSQLGTTRPPTPCPSLLLTPWRTRKIPTIPHP